MSRAKSWCAFCLTAVLMVAAPGCHPASNNTGTGSAPSTTKPEKQPENKDKPAKQPPPDIG